MVVDNSMMAPTFQQPLALGADISMTSATKFINGHSDIMAGILSVRGQDLAKKIYFTQVRCRCLCPVCFYHYCAMYCQLLMCLTCTATRPLLLPRLTWLLYSCTVLSQVFS